jgi:hypothetical protein
MTNLHIAPGLSLPKDVVTSTIVVYGGKGTGKTNYGSVLVEECSKVGLRWTYIDPLGVAWGLRHSADGKGKGIECIILGGVHGDIPIEPTAGSVVADLVVDEIGTNAIIDISRRPNGETWGTGEKIRFITEYGRRLFQYQGKLVAGRRREPILQVFDEAARYIPQTIPHGAEQLAACVGVWEQIAEEGRNFGIGIVFLTQRSARLNKSVSELADAMFSFRIVGPNSVAAVMDWMGDHVPKDRIKTLIESLRSLNVGQCLVVSPGWLKFEKIVQIRLRETFDSSATPKPGERPRKVTGEAAKPDLAKYAARMKETIERAKAEDPKELRARIRELEKQAKAQPVKQNSQSVNKNLQPDPAVMQRAIDRAVRQVEQAHAPMRILLEKSMKIIVKLNAIGFEGADVRPEDIDRLIKATTNELRKLAKASLSAKAAELEGLKREATALLKSIERVMSKEPISVNVDVHKLSADTSHIAPAVPVQDANTRANFQERSKLLIPPSNGDLPVGELACLKAIAQYNEGTERDQLSVLTGYKRSSRDAYVARLRGKGFIDDRNGRLIVTDDGIAALGSDYERLPTGSELQEYWRRKLPQGEKALFELIISNSGEPVDREWLGEQTGYKRSSRDAYLSRMMSRRIIEEAGRGMVRAATILFD